MDAIGTRRIRPATVDDARAIAEVHVASWRATYRGVLPDAFLDRLSVDEREAQRREILEDTSGEWGTLVAEEGGRVIGFAAFGPSRDDDAPPGTGEVPAIYVAPEVVGTGGRPRPGQIVLDAPVEARLCFGKGHWGLPVTRCDSPRMKSAAPPAVNARRRRSRFAGPGCRRVQPPSSMPSRPAS